MSDQSQGPGWWLASDGQWYPPSPNPAPPPPGQFAQTNQPGFVQPKTNGLAVASMVLGILWLWWIGSILALVFGYVARKQIDESRGAQSGRGMAIAGITLGWIGIAAIVLLIAALSLGQEASSSFSSTGSAIN